MRIDIITLFPEMFSGPFEASMVARALEKDITQIHLHNLRDFGEGKHRVVDDYPYGGGAGMLLKAGPAFAAVEAVQPQAKPPGRVVLLTPQGRLLDQKAVNELSELARLILFCGHYEGVDERVREHLADDEISIGDYVLSGGELPTMVLVDAIVRRLPGALGGETSLEEESHAEGLLEYPQYTRPARFRSWDVPDVLLSGHHEEVRRWRRKQSVLRTAERRRDLLESAELSDEDQAWLQDST